MRDNEAWLDELEMIREKRRIEYGEYQDEKADREYSEREADRDDAF